eukprot:2542275-Pyramimonas_sp.AAC.1
MQESRVPTTIGTCRTCLGTVGFEPIPGWECVWRHNKLGLRLSVYVDDFKLAGPAINLQAGWDHIRKSGTDLDPPTPYSQYLGCGQQAYDVPQN